MNCIRDIDGRNENQETEYYLLGSVLKSGVCDLEKGEKVEYRRRENEWI